MAMLGRGGTPNPRPDQSYRTPPPTWVAPGGAAGTFRGRLVIVYGTGAGQGVFVYSGTPALGNPPIFWASAVLTDPYGNTLKGYAGAASQGFYVVGNAGQADTTIGGGSVQWRSGSITQNGFIQVPAAGADYLQIQAPLIAGDTDAANLQLTSGTAGAAFTTLSPYGNDLRATNPNGLAETWHPLTLAAGWSNVAGHAPASYRLNALGNVEMTGRITGTVSGATQIATLPTGYYSTTYQRAYPCNVDASAGITPSETPHMYCGTAGSVQVTGLANGSANVDIDGTFMLSFG